MSENWPQKFKSELQLFGCTFWSGFPILLLKYKWYLFKVDKILKIYLLPCYFDTKSLKNIFDKYFTDGATFFEVNLSFDEF